jgi:hypothetical protein
MGEVIMELQEQKRNKIEDFNPELMKTDLAGGGFTYRIVKNAKYRTEPTKKYPVLPRPVAFVYVFRGQDTYVNEIEEAVHFFY